MDDDWELFTWYESIKFIVIKWKMLDKSHSNTILKVEQCYNQGNKLF